MLTSRSPGREAGPPKSETGSTTEIASSRRFRIAFSFAGEKRDFVEHVADILARRFGQDRILYDRFHEAEFAQWKLGLELPRLYHDESDLVVVVVCPDYNKKIWCGAEWGAIYGMLMKGRTKAVMLCRFGHAEIEGLYENAGFVELDAKTAEATAALVLQRLAINEGLPRDHYLDEDDLGLNAHALAGRDAPIPTPPDFYAEPSYIASHEFVGRAAELERLSDWAGPADVHPILLYEAIGGTGKSMLTWEWTTNHSMKVRTDWAGRIWYSFYERDAVMADFCRRALAYMRRKPLEDFRKKKTPELGEMLLRELRARPWLIILDGLERILVHYHRHDAAQTRDEDAGTTDPMDIHRDPCAAIRHEDDDLLRSLATASPSKLLISSRLTPHVLLNSSHQPIPGALRVPLPGLRPADAEAHFRNCGVTGTSQTIQSYLKSHCDCHPLVISVLAGLVNDYLPDRGNFDAWATDPEGGDHLDLASLDLIQKRNHILLSAIAALPEKGYQLLGTLALISESVDYETLSAFNPHLPPSPEEYADTMAASGRSPEAIAASRALRETVKDLERRGLLHYDRMAKRYDMHPVVRGVVAGRLKPNEKMSLGQRVVDHFSSQTLNSYDEVETIEDLQNGFRLVRVLLQLERFDSAMDVYDSIFLPLHCNLEAFSEFLALVRPFFPQGWGAGPIGIDNANVSSLTNDVAIALEQVGSYSEALVVYGASMAVRIRDLDWAGIGVCLYNLALLHLDKGRLGIGKRLLQDALNIATMARESASAVFVTRLAIFDHLVITGRWEDADSLWQQIDPMGRSWSRRDYRPGSAEASHATFAFMRGMLTEEHLAQGERLARAGKNRGSVREILRLRGRWQIDCESWSTAADNLAEAVQMAREVGLIDAPAETLLALTKLHLGQLIAPRQEAERLSSLREPAHDPLALIWLALDEHERAKKHALAAYQWAWADGEPYVRRFELDRARALLDRMGADIPNLPPYHPTKDPRFPWEEELQAALARLREEK